MTERVVRGELAGRAHDELQEWTRDKLRRRDRRGGLRALPLPFPLLNRSEPPIPVLTMMGVAGVGAGRAVRKALGLREEMVSSFWAPDPEWCDVP